MPFAPLAIQDFQTRVVPLFSREWFLLTAGDTNQFNTMTCAWGGLGFLWNQPVCFVFVRPQRFTYEFTEKQDIFTMSFFEESHRSKLTFCGSHSGRDCDKIEKTGLTPVFDPNGSIYFAEARLVIVCRKLYSQFLSESSFVDAAFGSSIYPEADFHRLYIAKIESILEAKS